jgi:hypothetical protein
MHFLHSEKNRLSKRTNACGDRIGIGYPTLEMIVSALCWYYQYQRRLGSLPFNENTLDGNPAQSEDVACLLKAYKLEDRDRAPNRSAAMSLLNLTAIGNWIQSESCGILCIHFRLALL